MARLARISMRSINEALPLLGAALSFPALPCLPGLPLVPALVCISCLFCTCPAAVCTLPSPAFVAVLRCPAMPCSLRFVCSKLIRCGILRIRM